MATCANCIHHSLCDYNTNVSGNGKIRLVYAEGADVKCSFFQNTADVVQKSEVERLQAEVDQLHALLECGGVFANSVEDWQKFLNEKRSEVAREIFEEIEKRLAMYSHIHKYAEEANKVTEEYADGTPVEMTSVWDACRLEHNGYDDYETMCKLQDNIGYIEKSRLLKEFEVDISQLKKKYTGERHESV